MGYRFIELVEWCCDNCAITLRTETDSRPIGWARVLLGDDGHAEPQAFCTESCARTWVANNVRYDVRTGDE